MKKCMLHTWAKSTSGMFDTALEFVVSFFDISFDMSFDDGEDDDEGEEVAIMRKGSTVSALNEWSIVKCISTL